MGREERTIRGERDKARGQRSTGKGKGEREDLRWLRVQNFKFRVLAKLGFRA